MKALARAFILVAYTAAATTAASAAEDSPLDLPVSRIMEVIAQAGSCAWDTSNTYLYIQCRSPETPYIKGAFSDWVAYIHFADKEKNKPVAGRPINDVELNVTTNKTQKGQYNIQAKFQIAAATEAVMTFLPQWAEGREWLAKALRESTPKHFSRSTRVGGTTILVQNVQPADLDGDFASITLTKKTDLCEFTDECFDDENFDVGPK